ncbi:hypothetical protein TTHERM_00205190 (macronuclear) [Tetrahymena thermophila SB210]|uniref:Uncharacterized protein n=1 Tax=Tetrahymena thermophila (strain SB210) TaxID=312017 RepID=Q22NC4_TETTS|nr:hypothetical protein TTHERM_00205190 [Tetrahymena thermophila SB210]EAR86861.2 hypothetical protein TTHERM_00205190 [Tetrahymena thermophila SB210]|eukprot:XP_001007106.2 hypothetical protein TTHERM_00205190 [Tetrahymena thermophila SB210]
MSSSKQQHKKKALSTLQNHRVQCHPSYENTYRDENIEVNKENKKDQNYLIQQQQIQQNQLRKHSFSKGREQSYNQIQMKQEQNEKYSYRQLSQNQSVDQIPQKIQCSVTDTTTEIKWKELQEMDEEEMYIERLRQQRKKIDEIKGEFVQKIDYYNELEIKLKELAKYKPYFEKYNQLKKIMEQTLEKLDKRETDYKCQKEQNNLLKAQIKELQEKNADGKKDNLQLLEDIEQRKIQNSQLQNQIRSMIAKENEIQYQLKAQQDKFESLDQLFKQQMTQTKIENIKLFDNLNIIKQLNEQIIILKSSKEESNVNNQRLQQQIIEQQEEINKIKDEKAIILKELQRKTSEIDDLKVKFQELEYNQIMINAKKSIMQEEFEQKRALNDNNLEEFKFIINEQEEELKKSRTLNQLLSVEYDTAVKKIKEFEQEIWEYRKENHNLKVKLSNILQGKGELIIPNQKLVKEELDQLEKDIFSFKKAQMIKQQNEQQAKNYDYKNSNNNNKNNIIPSSDDGNSSEALYSYANRIQNQPTQDSCYNLSNANCNTSKSNNNNNNNNYYNIETDKYNSSNAQLYSNYSEQPQFQNNLNNSHFSNHNYNQF